MSDIVVEELYVRDHEASTKLARALESQWMDLEAGRLKSISDLEQRSAAAVATIVARTPRDRVFKNLFRERVYGWHYRLDQEAGLMTNHVERGDPRVLLDATYRTSHINIGNPAEGNFESVVIQNRSQHATYFKERRDAVPDQKIYKAITLLPDFLLFQFALNFANPASARRLGPEGVGDPFHLLEPDEARIHRLLFGDSETNFVIQAIGVENLQQFVWRARDGRILPGMKLVVQNEDLDRKAYGYVKNADGSFFGFCMWTYDSDGRPAQFINIYPDAEGKLKAKLQRILHMRKAQPDMAAFGSSEKLVSGMKG